MQEEWSCWDFLATSGPLAHTCKLAQQYRAQPGVPDILPVITTRIYLQKQRGNNHVQKGSRVAAFWQKFACHIDLHAS